MVNPCSYLVKLFHQTNSFILTPPPLLWHKVDKNYSYYIFDRGLNDLNNLPVIVYNCSQYLTYKHMGILSIQLWIKGYTTIILLPENSLLIQYSHLGSNYLNDGNVSRLLWSRRINGTFLCSSSSVMVDAWSFIREWSVV